MGARKLNDKLNILSANIRKYRLQDYNTFKVHTK